MCSREESKAQVDANWLMFSSAIEAQGNEDEGTFVVMEFGVLSNHYAY